MINYIVNVILISDYFHDYEFFEKATLCGFNPFQPGVSL